MKNTMKKIMGLLLVAVLLVSVVPFQALAATGDDIVFKVKENDSDDIAYEVTQPSKNGETTVKAMLDYWYKGSYESITSVYMNGSTQSGDLASIVVKDGDKVTVRVKTAAAPTEAPTEKPTEAPTEKPTEAPKNELIRFQIKFDDSDEVAYTKIATPEGDTATVKNLLTYWFDSSWTNNYEFKHAYSVNDGKTYTDIDTAIAVGDTVTIRLAKKAASTKPTDPTKPTAEAITVEVKVNKSSNVVKTFTKVPENGESAKVGDLLTYGWKQNWRNDYDFDHAYCNGKTLYSLNDIIKAGNTVSILLTTDDSTNSTTDNKFPYKVYLHVYLNNKIDEPDKTFTITKTLASDGVVSVSEVKNLIKENYKAKDSDGIQYDGLYLAKGNWVKDYVNDNKSSKLEDLDIRVGQEYVHINLMITNATRKSTSTADSSNPKTGDAIFMTITVMGLSAAALTGMYFYDKKRKAL